MGNAVPEIGKFGVLNLGGEVRCKLQAKVDEWQWDDRSMYFHSTWRYQNTIRRDRSATGITWR